MQMAVSRDGRGLIWSHRLDLVGGNVCLCLQVPDESSQMFSHLVDGDEVGRF